MTLGRRLLMGGRGVSPVGQAEYDLPGTYMFRVPAGVRYLDGVAIGAGASGSNTSPFNGGWGGNLHWRNRIPVTPGEWLTVKVGDGDGYSGSKETYLRRGATNLLYAANRNFSTPQHPTLGGGGGDGGAFGPGSPGNGGYGGGGPGYTGKGGRGGSYLDTYSGEFPDTDSGGGRGGDKNGVPTGWQNESGEGTGMLGRSPDKTTSLGTVRCGWGGWAAGSGGGDGGLRLIWGGSRAFPDNVPDLAAAMVAEFISAANGTGSAPVAFTFHTDAQPGDLVVMFPRITGSGTFAGVTGSSNWNNTSGGAYWKQVTQDDLDASLAGTVKFGNSGTWSWIAVVYRGPTIARGRRNISDFPPSDTVTIPGITKRVDCKRVVTYAADPDVGSIPTPSGFTSRQARTTPPMRVSDKAPADYANGENVVYSPMGVTTGATAQLIELF